MSVASHDTRATRSTRRTAGSVRRSRAVRASQSTTGTRRSRNRLLRPVATSRKQVKDKALSAQRHTESQQKLLAKSGRGGVLSGGAVPRIAPSVVAAFYKTMAPKCVERSAKGHGGCTRGRMITSVGYRAMATAATDGDQGVLADEQLQPLDAWLAAERGDIDTLKAVLGIDGFDKRPGLFPNETPLHRAAAKGQLDTVRCVPPRSSSLTVDIWCCPAHTHTGHPTAGEVSVRQQSHHHCEGQYGLEYVAYWLLLQCK